MIQQYIDIVFKPFRDVWAKVRGVQNKAYEIKGDAHRLKEMGKRGKARAKEAQDQAKALAAKGQAGVAAAQGQAQAAQGAAAGAVGQVQAAQGAAQGAVGQAQGAAAQAQGQIAPPAATDKKAKKKMGLFGKKNVCPNCGQPQEKGWDKCPFCMSTGAPGGPGGAPGAPGGAPGGPGAPPGAPGGFGAPPGYAPPGGGFGPPVGSGGAQKTMMFGGSAGAATGQQLVGWVIPLKGPHRGELHTLKPQSVIGKDPACDVVFNDPFMSSRHATIKAQGGVFILEDHSTNGTFVNDKKVKTHELVDNDFVKFGQTLVKFKSL